MFDVAPVGSLAHVGVFITDTPHLTARPISPHTQVGSLAHVGVFQLMLRLNRELEDKKQWLQLTVGSNPTG